MPENLTVLWQLTAGRVRHLSLRKASAVPLGPSLRSSVQLGAMRRAAKLFGQVRKHGLTGILGFGKRLKG